MAQKKFDWSNYMKRRRMLEHKSKEEARRNVGYMEYNKEERRTLRAIREHKLEQRLLSDNFNYAAF